MSFFKPVGKAAKFAFVTVPASIFGWQMNKRIFQLTRSAWTRTVNPPCPFCDNGVMFIHQDVDPVYEQDQNDEAPRQLYPWVCTHCGYALLESSDIKRVRETVNQQREVRA